MYTIMDNVLSETRGEEGGREGDNRRKRERERHDISKLTTVNGVVLTCLS
jgi:hypothetical protein